MKRLQLPEAFRMLPNRIEGAGIEVFLFEAPLTNDNDTELELKHHTLMLLLEGSVNFHSNNSIESISKDEAIMIRKNSTVRMKISDQDQELFRCLLIFFDEPSLKYALMPFELTSGTSSVEVLKIPLNEKIKIFTESLLLYYQSFKEKNNWALLLQGKLRELIWIFFHTSIKEKAREFFSVAP